MLVMSTETEEMDLRKGAVVVVKLKVAVPVFCKVLLTKVTLLVKAPGVKTNPPRGIKVTPLVIPLFQAYVEAPDPFNVAESPAQTVVFGPPLTTGS